jgi:hypothetical protein
MDDVIPWWRQNFVEEFGALTADIATDNSEDSNFLGGTEADRKLTKERVQVSLVPSPVLVVICFDYTTLVKYLTAECFPEDSVSSQVRAAAMTTFLSPIALFLQNEKRRGGSASVQGVPHVRGFILFHHRNYLKMGFHRAYSLNQLLRSFLCFLRQVYYWCWRSCSVTSLF